MSLKKLYLGVPIYLLFLFLISVKNGIAREARPYTACAPFEFPSLGSGQASPCSDYMKSRNDTHFQAPLLRVTQRLDEAYDEYYTTVDPNVQQELEQAVIKAISTIAEFPFYELQCQNAIVGAICAGYFPPCDTSLNEHIENGCPNDQDLFSNNFAKCNPTVLRGSARNSPQCFADFPKPKLDGVNLDNYYDPNGGQCIPKASGSCGLIEKYCPIININPDRKAIAPLFQTSESISLISLYSMLTTRSVPLSPDEVNLRIPAGSLPFRVIPECLHHTDECFDPYKSNGSVSAVIQSIPFPVKIRGGPESNICDKYTDLIQLHGSPTWKTTIQRIHRYLSSHVAENSFPKWLPSNCSSALKQLVCSSPFGGLKQGFYGPSFQRDESTCSVVCSAVEKYCKSIFDMKPTVFQNVTNNYTLYVIRNDIVPRIRSGGVLNSLQTDIPIYEHTKSDGCKRVLSGVMPSFIGYPEGIDFSRQVDVFNNLLQLLRANNRSYALGLDADTNSCGEAFLATNCTTCNTKCPEATFEHDVPEISATYMVLSSACAMPCPFNTRKRIEYEESIMTRFIGGTVGGISGLFLMWLWFAEEEKKSQRTLNMLFFASVITSTAMVLGPNFKPFKYFCASNVRVMTQKVGDLNTCIVEASIIIFGINLFSLLWFCLILERITIEILQKPSILEATPITFVEKVRYYLRIFFYRFVVFPVPERGDERRCPIYFFGSVFVSAGIVAAAYAYELLGYDGVGSWCSWVHISHTSKNYLYSATGLHYAPLASLYQFGLFLLFYRFLYHVKYGGLKNGIFKAILNRMSIFLIWFGMMWCFMIYKKMTSDVAGIFERQESTSKWHKCMLLNVSNPLVEYSKKSNATMTLEKECTPLPEVRVLHSLTLGAETLVSTGGYLLLIAWGSSLSHISWIAKEFGFTRSGLSWESDKEEKRKIIIDENLRKRQAEEELSQKQGSIGKNKSNGGV